MIFMRALFSLKKIVSRISMPESIIKSICKFFKLGLVIFKSQGKIRIFFQIILVVGGMYLLACSALYWRMADWAMQDTQVAPFPTIFSWSSRDTYAKNWMVDTCVVAVGNYHGTSRVYQLASASRGLSRLLP